MAIRMLLVLMILTGPALCLADESGGSPSPAEQTVWTAVNGEANNPTAYGVPEGLPREAPEQSQEFCGIVFTGRYANYTKADTWYPSWASDGNLYSPWTDGTIGKMRIWSNSGKTARTGYTRIEGDDPLNLTISDWGARVASALPYQGRYPCGSLLHDGVWYYGTYGIDQPTQSVRSKFGWYVLGPLVGFSWSTDYGKTWHETPHTPDQPLFPEVSRDQLDMDKGQEGRFVKMGAPHFVDFGRIVQVVRSVQFLMK